MPIRINLLAEEHDNRGQKFRDPQFLAYAVAGTICFLVTIYSLSVFLGKQELVSELTQKNAGWAANEKRYKELESMLNDSIDMDRKIQSLQRYATNRFLWGSVLEDFQNTTLNNIYISSLQGKQEMVFEAQKNQGNTVIPAQVIERTKLIVKGFDSSPNRQLSINSYTRNLVDAGQMSQLISSPGQMELKEVGLRRQDPIDSSISYVDFTLICNFNQKIHR